MSANSKIEWTDHTFNPWIGCTKVSPGCLHCYAETRSKRTDGVVWGKGKPRKRTSAANWKQPLRWNEMAKVCSGCGQSFNYGYDDGQQCPDLCGGVLHRARVFCASLADWLDDEVAIEWLADLIALIRATPNLDWLLLTKRPENWLDRITAVFEFTGQDQEHFSKWFGTYELCEEWLSEGEWHRVPGNIWVGTSVEDQARADERIPKLQEIPAKVRFLSCEPLLGAVRLSGSALGQSINRPGVDWVIVGGESGPGARECNVRWPLQIVAQCKARGVAAFVKQLGALVVDRNDAGFDGKTPREWPMGTDTRDIDPGYQGAPVRVLLHSRKGGDPAEWPEDLRVREFPQLVTGHLAQVTSPL